MNFCPHCGQATLEWNNWNKWSCSSCHFVLYNNVAGAVAVIVRCGDEVMFTRRNQEPKKGKLDLAGGFTDPKETAEQTCVRELKEELQIVVNPEHLKYVAGLPNTYQYKEIDYNTLDLFFEYRVDSKFDVILEESEISAIVWKKINELDFDEVAFDSQKKFFSTYR